MTVNAIGTRVTYPTNGVTTQWFFPFAGNDPADILVFISGAQIPQGQYTVILSPPTPPNPTSISGTVIYPIAGPAVAAGNTITIALDMDFSQDTSIANQSIIYPPVIEQEFDRLALADQQLADQQSRFIGVGPTEPAPAPLPPVALRANHAAFFDSNGNLTAGVGDVSTVNISAVMKPVVAAATLVEAQTLMGFGPSGYAALNGSKFNLFSTTTILASQKGLTFDLTGDLYYSVVFTAPNTYQNDFQVLLYNSSNRGKQIIVPGIVPFNIFPRQWCLVSNSATQAYFIVTQVGRWRPGVPSNIYVNPVVGNDTGDGLATGADAFKTIQRAINMIEKEVDGQFTINLADGAHNVNDGLLCAQGVVGASTYSIIGNVTTPGNCQIFTTPDNRQLFTVQDSAAVVIRGVRFTSVGGTYYIHATRNGTVTLGKVEFDPVNPPAINMLCDTGAVINIDQPYTIRGGAADHIYCAQASINYSPGTVTISAAAAYSGEFIRCLNLGSISSQLVPQTFVNSGLVTGKKYTIDRNAVVDLAGTTIPGTVAGTTSTGGIIA